MKSEKCNFVLAFIAMVIGMISFSFNASAQGLTDQDRKEIEGEVIRVIKTRDANIEQTVKLAHNGVASAQREVGKAYYSMSIDSKTDDIGEYNTDGTYYNMKPIGESYERVLRELAFEWFEKAAKGGDAEGNFYLGAFYHKGIYPTKNTVKAVQYYNIARTKGSASAANNLGVLYQNGIGVNTNLQKAFELYTEAANKGNSFAQGHLGEMYYKGIHVQKNPAKAFEYLKKSADAYIPCPFGCRMLASCYRYGIGTTKNERNEKMYMAGAFSLRDEKTLNDQMKMDENGALEEEEDGIDDWIEFQFDRDESIRRSADLVMRAMLSCLE